MQGEVGRGVDRTGRESSPPPACCSNVYPARQTGLLAALRQGMLYRQLSVVSARHHRHALVCSVTQTLGVGQDSDDLAYLYPCVNSYDSY